MRAWLARLIPRNDVDDLVQETLARAWRYRSTFDSGRELGPWLRSAALRVALDHRAREQRRPRTSELDVEPEERAALGSERQMEARDELDALLVRLEPVERDILLRFHRAGHSVADIASVLGLPVGTVKSHLHRARRKLAQGGREGDRS
jgi:RNA polymerase sigma-70 factor (ECF subfamily)